MKTEIAKRPVPLVVWTVALSIVAMMWVYWSGVVLLAEQWERNPQYSHGYLVPLIAIVLLWFRYSILDMGQPQGGRIGWALLAIGIAGFFIVPATILREWGFVLASIALIGAGWILYPTQLDADRLRPSWWGMPLLILGIVLHLSAGYFYIEWFAHLSLIPVLAGLVLLTVGWRGVRWGWPAILFVGFMIPLPHSAEGLLRSPLRKVGTKASTYLMQTCNLPAFAEGNRNEIIVGGMTHRIGVNEACSGLSMLMIFFALAAAVAVVVQRSIWERAFIVLSAVPIAIIANVMRITITGIMLYALQDRDVYVGLGGLVLIDKTGTEFAQSFFHDWAGWMMMPFALFLLWLELAILKRIIVVEQEKPLAVGVTSGLKQVETETEVQKSSRRKSAGDTGNSPALGGAR